ncbi:MAG TPA: VanZ family protein [Xanthomonadaceae bacterium]|nr:VanZ family protein [Xanthomonadaceae bacterium]
MNATAWLKPLRHARGWLALWVLAVLAAIAVELLPAMFLPRVPAGGDKLEHVLGYALLAFAAGQVFARRAWARVGIGLVLLGLLLEIAQGTLTATRSADPGDALANGAGVLLGLGCAFTPLGDLLLRRAGTAAAGRDRG